MARTIRESIKAQFDRIVYQYGWLNRILRNLNKAFSPFTRFRLRPYGELHLQLASGLRFKLATNQTSNVAKKLFWNGPDQYEYSPILEKLVVKCTAFADIGANIGYYSLLAATANPGLKVYAFEPASGPLHFLKKNVTINGLEKRISVSGIALSNAAGNLEFHEFRSGTVDGHFNLGGAGKLLLEGDSRADIVPVLVPTQTTDFFFKSLSPLPDLIKMDTEGTEHLILEGATELIHKTHPVIICETLFGVIESKLDAIMKAHGYHFYNYANGKLVKVDSIVRTTDNGVSDCFFVHPDKETRILEFC